MDKLKESDLYQPVKAYLETLGYDIKAEVRNCDITATKDDKLIVIELKTGFTLELIYQGIRRQSVADGVYLAVPLPKQGYRAPRYPDMLRLCRRLELGLIFVAFTIEGKPQIDVAAHPAPKSAVRRNKKERMAILTEHNTRTGSANTGGVTRRKILTVYKERALKIAEILAREGELRATDIRALCGYDNTSAILKRNFYKWYDKAQDLGNRNTTYCVTAEGLQALEVYRDYIDAT